ncbi:MAG TPA: kynureninase [Candidatus Paceibacterota bacterium]
MDKKYTLEYAKELDRTDELRTFRDAFHVEDPALVYLDGNSLGRTPKRAFNIVQEHAKDKWGNRLVRAWGEGWMMLSERIGDKIAGLIGAETGEVVVADSTSVNLFKLAAAALADHPERTEIVTDELNFPSDLYILQGLVKLFGNKHTIRVVKSEDGLTISTAAIARELNDKTALVALTATAFKSGFNYNIEAITKLAHEKGAYALWDLSHSVGAVPIDLKAANVDLAIGCTYKYLNGGPGAPAFLYVRKDLQSRLSNPIAGWFGHGNQFDFELEYKPADSIRKFLTGTPSILSLAAIEAGVDLIHEAGIQKLRAKSVQQSEYFIELFEHALKPLGVVLRSPRDVRERGSHVSLGHPEGYRIDQALIQEMQVIPDFRNPDNMRFGFTPLYTTYEEIFKAIEALRHILEHKTYEQYSSERVIVT